MPEISRFFGIVIKMFFDDQDPPHFHAEYGDTAALIDIRNLSVFSGRLPPRAMGLVIEWATLHRQELLADWERARSVRLPRTLDGFTHDGYHLRPVLRVACGGWQSGP